MFVPTTDKESSLKTSKFFLHFSGGDITYKDHGLLSLLPTLPHTVRDFKINVAKLTLFTLDSSISSGQFSLVVQEGPTFIDPVLLQEDT
jgi:hypothetical protein